MPIAAVVIFQAKLGSEQSLQAAMQENAAAARSDSGFIRIRILRDIDDPRTFVYLEDWASHASLMEHLGTTHVARFKAVSENLVVNKIVRVLDGLSEISSVN